MTAPLPTPDLANLLDLLSLPMAALAGGPDVPLQITQTNAGFAMLTGFPKDALKGRHLGQLTSVSTATALAGLLRDTNPSEQTVHLPCSFEGRSTAPNQHLSIQPLPGPGEPDRLIATVAAAPTECTPLSDRLAFDDLRYFSCIADLQLEDLSNALECVADQPANIPTVQGRIDRLHAVCRTIQSTMTDIRDVVRAAQARHAGLNAPSGTNQATRITNGTFEPSLAEADVEYVTD